MEFIHGHTADIGMTPLAQGLVGKNLRRAAYHWRIRIDMGVTGNHPHPVTPQNLDQIEELFRDQGLDGRRVV